MFSIVSLVTSISPAVGCRGVLAFASVTTTEPVLGLDKETRIAYNVLKPVSPALKQDKTVAATFHDGDHSSKIEGSNAFFHSNANGAGSV